MIDLNAPTTLDEIAQALKISKEAARKKAKDWRYSERQMHGKNKQRMYAFKDIPSEIMRAVLTYRMKEMNKNEQSIKSSQPGHQNTANTQNANVESRNGGGVRALDTRNDSGTTQVAVDSGRRQGSGSIDGDRRQTNDISTSQNHGQGDTATGVGVDSNTGLRVLDTDGKRAVGDGVLHGEIRPTDTGSSGKKSALVSVEPSKTTEKQRKTDGSRRYIVNFVGNFDGSDTAALEFLNQGYLDGTLSVDLLDCYQHCNDKMGKSGKVKPLKLRTFQRWKKKIEDDGNCLPKLTRTETPWNEYPWVWLFLGHYRKPQKPSLVDAHNAMLAVWTRSDFPGDCPSYDSVFRLKDKIPPLVLQWGRSSGSHYKAMQAFIRRDWSGNSNEVWVGDGHTFKAKVRHPDAPDRLAFAPEVTVIIDAASRFIVGWAFSLSENQIAVSEALGTGMMKHGKPLIYYSDNGSGQTAKTIDAPAGGMLARLGVAHETGIPGNPQGRGLIEGLWDITTIYVAKQYPTYQGKAMDSDALRKITAGINSAKTKNGVMPEFVPTWEEFMTDCEARFDWYNTQHKHSSLGGKTPAEVYHANFDESWACKLTDEERATLYRPYVLRTPRRGEVRFINNIYFHKALEALPVNAQVQVAYDLHDADQVWISDLDGVFVCEAIWDGNKVDGFAKTYVEELKQQRVKGIKKRATDKLDAAELEAGAVLEGEFRQVIEFVLPETAPEKIVLQPVIEQPEVVEKQRVDNLFPLNPPTEERKLTADETWQRLFLNDQDEEEVQEKKRI